MAATLLVLISLFSCVMSFFRWRKSPYRRMPKGAKPLPGPKGLPFIGRIHDLPAEETWLKFYEWGNKYGPIYKMEIFGDTHVFISDEDLNREIMARKGGIYSDRPVIANLPDNKYSGMYLPLLGRNEIWTRQRKFAHQIIPNALTVPINQPKAFIPEQERSLLLYRLLLNPDSYAEQIESFTARASSRFAWGTAAHASDLAEATMKLLITISPSGSLPNAIPWLAELPYWASPWKKEEARRRAFEEDLWKRTFSGARTRFENGKAAHGEGLQDCYTKTYFESLEAEKQNGKKVIPVSDTEAMNNIGMMAIASALTIGSPIQSFVLAMLEYPEWQTKLQEEIDQVCDGRVPQWTDRANMPIMRAVVKEVCRWRAPVPTGIPHSLEQDDIWNNYFIPANSVIHAFEYGFNRSPNTYSSPHLFNPGRWLSPVYPTYKAPLSIYPNLKGYSQYGHGRRICQGVEVVEQELFIAMSGIAWAFAIVPRGCGIAGGGGGDGVGMGGVLGMGMGMGMDDGKPECQVCAERQVSGGRGGRKGKPDLKYSSLLIAKPVDFSAEFRLKVRGVERGRRIVEGAVEAMRAEGREVFEGLGDPGCGVVDDDSGVKSTTTTTTIEVDTSESEKAKISFVVFERNGFEGDGESDGSSSRSIGESTVTTEKNVRIMPAENGGRQEIGMGLTNGVESESNTDCVGGREEDGD